MKSHLMTDRHSGYVVVLANDVREDDAEPIMAAIRMIKGVVDVRPVVGDNISTIAQARAEHLIKQKVLDALK